MFKPIALLLSLSVAANAFNYKCYRGGADAYVSEGILKYHRDQIIPLGVNLFSDMKDDKDEESHSVYASSRTDFDVITIYMETIMVIDDYAKGVGSKDMLTVIDEFKKLAGASDVVNDELTCRVFDVRGCMVGAIKYETYKGGLIGNPRNVVSHGRTNNVTYGFQSVKNYKPPTSIRLPPQNGTPLCKRDDPKHYLWRCRAPHSMITGDILRQGRSLRTPTGNTLTMQKDGNLCAAGPDGKKYWCFRNSVAPIPGPYEMHVERDGNTCFYGKGGKSYGCGNKLAPNSEYGYRLSIQNDGNIVAYDRDNKAVFATGTVIFPKNTGPNVCRDI
ncbi:hypothetical protein BGZ93_010098 [Podila epicladia]|nr:hypothetical protein BGZ92_006331 [Podila epicladia]KAG0098843.1 hypothetical protein BGZ93_010098 [Podila epicladia]